jgi:hypothetical protein
MLRQEDHELEASLWYIARPCLKKQKQTYKKRLFISMPNYKVISSGLVEWLKWYSICLAKVSPEFKPQC